MKLSPVWLAGFFDGEGCVTITRTGANRYPALRLDLANTNTDVLGRIQAEYGGHLRVAEHKLKPSWKPFGVLVWQAGRASQIADVIRPHAVLKLPQLMLALEFVSFMRRPRSERCVATRSPCVQMPNRMIWVKRPEVIMAEESFVERMRCLNRKGVVSHDAITAA